MLPDCCTSSHGQEESTENRDKTNESNKSKLSKTIIFIQCIRIYTRLWAQRIQTCKLIRARAQMKDTKKRGSTMVLPFLSGAYLKHYQQGIKEKELLCDRCRFAFLANKRQKEVRAHVSQRLAQKFSSNVRDRKQKRFLQRQIQH